MKSILRINTQQLNNNVEERDSEKVLLPPTLNSYHDVNVMTSILSRNDFEDDSYLKFIIESLKDIQLMEHKNISND